MRDETVRFIVKKFICQAIVFGSWFLNWILRNHPEIADSEDVHKLRALLRELKEEEPHI